MKRDKIIYWVFTGLFSFMLGAGGIAYFVAYDMTAEMFTSLGVPTEIIYPLATAKLLGVVAILTKKSELLKKLAYLGFALDLTFAIIAHVMAGDGEHFGPVIPLLLLIGSFVYDRKVFGKASA